MNDVFNYNYMRNNFVLYVLALILFLSCAKSSGGGGGGNADLPALSVNNPSPLARNTTGLSTVNMRFFVTLSTSYTSDVTVTYTTVSGTAMANKDFIPVASTLTIPSGQTTGYVDVSVTADSTRNNNLLFYLLLSNPSNATISGSDSAVGTIQCNGTYMPIDTTSLTGGYSSPTSYPGYNLTWSDEFTGKTLNPANWSYDIGGNGWGNGELEYYTSNNKNSFLSNGCLVIEARNEVFAANNYTSARIKTQGLQSFQYGRIDIRAKLPVGSGAWPALWMLGSNYTSVGWPLCGETDIMELKGGINAAQIWGSLHWKNNDGSEGTENNTAQITPGDFSQQFHVFSLIWKQNYIQFLVDNSPYETRYNTDVTNGTWPFNAPQFFIFNLAVGGNFPGPVVSTTFPQRMIVDYVRVFQ